MFAGAALFAMARPAAGDEPGAAAALARVSQGQVAVPASASAMQAALLAASAPLVVDGQPRTRAEVYAGVRAMQALGQQLFNDPALSGSGRLACASCHSPQHGYGPPNALDVQLGGPHLRSPGMRAVPSLTYLQAVPPFAEHFHDSDDEGDESIDNGPTGGLTWDGRVDSGADQARMPLTSIFEMDSTPARVAHAVRIARYASEFRETFGARALADDQATFNAVLRALDAYEQTPARFYPYTSKYDAYLAGRVQLTPAELRGLRLFNSPDKGNCASCHISRPALDGTPPSFSDFGLIALGVPRNRRLAVNHDPKFYDLGACGPLRTDLHGRGEFCGLFRTPSLRNVALRHTFFHNGIYHSLEDVLHFYVERDTDPAKFYPVEHGRVRKFDDLPRRYWSNLNNDPPFGGKPGDRPALNEAEIRDIITFLGTLTDGYASPPAMASGIQVNAASAHSGAY